MGITLYDLFHCTEATLSALHIDVFYQATLQIKPINPIMATSGC